jgi:hypothetical protein
VRKCPRSVHTPSRMRRKRDWVLCRPPDEGSKRRHSSRVRNHQIPLADAVVNNRTLRRVHLDSSLARAHRACQSDAGLRSSPRANVRAVGACHSRSGVCRRALSPMARMDANFRQSMSGGRCAGNDRICAEELCVLGMLTRMIGLLTFHLREPRPRASLHARRLRCVPLSRIRAHSTEGGR